MIHCRRLRVASTIGYVRNVASLKFIDTIRQSVAKRTPKRILLPEAQDPRVLEAANILASQNLATPVLINSTDSTLPVVPVGVEVVSISSCGRLEEFSQTMLEIRHKKGITAQKAKELVADPLIFAGMMLRAGLGHGCVAGSIAATADVIRAALTTVGTKPAMKTVSSCFVMVMPDRTLTFADCAVVPQPTSEQLADIAAASAETHHMLVGEMPKVALLSHSSKGSADNADVQKVRRAGEQLRRQFPNLAFEDELQLDAAIIPSIAKKKVPSSQVAGHCNVLVFPDLDAGNIGYKLTERLAGAQAIGPLIQGLSKPYMDLSRGCSVDDIVNVACIASLL